MLDENMEQLALTATQKKGCFENNATESSCVEDIAFVCLFSFTEMGSL